MVSLTLSINKMSCVHLFLWRYAVRQQMCTSITRTEITPTYERLSFCDESAVENETPEFPPPGVDLGEGQSAGQMYQFVLSLCDLQCSSVGPVGAGTVKPVNGSCWIAAASAAVKLSRAAVYYLLWPCAGGWWAVLG